MFDDEGNLAPFSDAALARLDEDTATLALEHIDAMTKAEEEKKATRVPQLSVIAKSR